jgi:hypothetical protein
MPEAGDDRLSARPTRPPVALHTGRRIDEPRPVRLTLRIAVSSARNVEGLAGSLGTDRTEGA